MLLSVVIPALNEGRCLPSLLETLSGMPGEKEVIVADGGSADDTATIAERWGASVVAAPRGRAIQMNAGAAVARGDALWFVHADSLLAASSLRDIEEALGGGASGGFFRLYFYDTERRFLRFISRTSHTRAGRFGLIFGDQGLFLRRDVFEGLGGFASLALMEDWELSRRLRPLHRRGLIRALDTPIGTSARRYLQNGALRTWFRMNVVKGLYICGVPTEKLRELYDGG